MGGPIVVRHLFFFFFLDDDEEEAAGDVWDRATAKEIVGGARTKMPNIILGGRIFSNLFLRCRIGEAPTIDGLDTNR